MSKQQKTAHRSHSKFSRLTFRATGQASGHRTKYTYDAFGILIERRARRESDGELIAFEDPASETAPAGTQPAISWYRYTGEQWDPDIEMYYLRARYYKPEIGRFWTMDTYEGSQSDPLSLHKYLYCHGNPVNALDPSGLADYSLTLSYAAEGWGDWQLGADLWWATTDGLKHKLPACKSITVSTIGENENIYELVSAALSDLVPGVDHITKITIAGHGAPGYIGHYEANTNSSSQLWLDYMDEKSSRPQSRMIGHLSTFTTSETKVLLAACNQADSNRGKKMMQLLSRRLGGAAVVGYTDLYGVQGWGDQYTAKGDSFRRTKTGPDFEHGWLNSAVEYLRDIGRGYIGF